MLCLLPPPPQIVIGRNQGATMQLNDGEISGQHAAVRWSSVDKCWKVRQEGGGEGRGGQGSTGQAASALRCAPKSCGHPTLLRPAADDKLGARIWPTTPACPLCLCRLLPPLSSLLPHAHAHAQVADLGSLNGTLLNGEAISVAGRKRGRDYRLSTDDILQVLCLGTGRPLS